MIPLVMVSFDHWFDPDMILQYHEKQAAMSHNHVFEYLVAFSVCSQCHKFLEDGHF